MKFGRYIKDAAIPEWESKYVNYKALKKILKKLPRFEASQSSLMRRKISRSRSESPQSQSTANSKSEKSMKEETREEEVKIEKIPGSHVEMSDLGVEELEPLRPSYKIISDPSTGVKRVFYIPVVTKNIQSLKDSLDTDEIQDDEMHLRSLIPESVKNDPVVGPIEQEFFNFLEGEIEKSANFFLENVKKLSDQVDSLLESTRERIMPSEDGKSSQTDSNQIKVKIETLKAKLKSVGSRNEVKQAFREVYHGLCLIKNFHIVNYLAVCKILKKHDKVSIWKRSTPIVLSRLQSEDPSVLWPQLNPIPKMMGTLERIFPKYIDTGKSKEDALESLRNRNTVGLDSAWKTFRAGFASGIVVASFICSLTAFLVWASLDSDFFSSVFFGTGSSGIRKEISSAIPIFRFILLAGLHLFLWGLNVFFFEKKKVNVKFIMDTYPKTFLGFAEIIFISSVLLTFLVLVTIIYILAVNFQDKFSITHPGALHLALFCSFFIALFLPIRRLYWPTRKYFLSKCLSLLLTPFTEIGFEHSFIADQFISAQVALLDVQYSLYYYFSGSFLNYSSTFISRLSYVIPACFVALLPYSWRFGQCCRRYLDDPSGRKFHMLNAIKYFSSIVSIIMSYALRIRRLSGFWTSWLIISILSKIYGFVWDITRDWGFVSINWNYNGRLVYPTLAKGSRFSGTHSVVVIFWNFILRMAFIFNFWLFSDPGRYGEDFLREMSVLFLSVLEIHRRSMWNNYRVENEHYNNCEHFRAFADIPEVLQ